MIKIPAKVLIVDDEKDFVQMFSLRLQAEGEKVSTAYSGKEALEVLSHVAIDVVILDIRMPGMDGIDTLKPIKSKYPPVEVYLLTGHGLTEKRWWRGKKTGGPLNYLKKTGPNFGRKLTPRSWKKGAGNTRGLNQGRNRDPPRG